MSTQQESTTAARQKPSYPRFWNWDEDGPLLAAPFVRFSQGQTKLFGPKPIAVVEVDGEERSVWLTQTVLFRQFRDELQRRPDHKLAPGERISSEKHEKKQSEEGGYAYTPFTTIFHDAPELSETDLFELDTKKQEPKKPEEEPASSSQDDGIPF